MGRRSGEKKGPRAPPTKTWCNPAAVLKLCLPRNESLGGGASSFYRNLRSYLAAAGIPFTDRLDDDYDALWVNSWVLPYRAVLHARRSHPAVRTLHRIDGCGLDYGRAAIADLRQALVNLLADVTVFQSHYGKYATTEKYRVIGQDGPVIHNAVDVERFRPEGERVPLPGRISVCHVTHSTNPKKGAALLYALAGAHPAVDFVLIGRYEAPPPLPNLHLLGYVDWDMLPKVLRSSSLFLMLAENEACPNVVLEAMASGLPVLYRPSGGTPELVGRCGRAIEPDTFSDALAWALERRALLGEAARARAVEQFSPGVIFPRYLDALERAPRRSLRAGWGWTRALRVDRAILAGLVRWGVAWVAGGARARCEARAR